MWQYEHFEIKSQKSTQYQNSIGLYVCSFCKIVTRSVTCPIEIQHPISFHAAPREAQMMPISIVKGQVCGSHFSIYKNLKAAMSMHEVMLL